MAKRKVIAIGCGGRGKTYTDIMANHFADDFEVVAVAEPVEDRRNYKVMSSQRFWDEITKEMNKHG